MPSLTFRVGISVVDDDSLSSPWILPDEKLFSSLNMFNEAIASFVFGVFK